MSHADAKAALDSFRSIRWTDGKGNTLTTTQITSKSSALYDKERTLRKSAEQQAEIDRLKSLLEAKESKKKSA